MHASCLFAMGSASGSAGAPAGAHDPVVCAAFAFGSASSNDCPARHLRLDTAVACEIVAGIANRMYGGIVTLPGLPAGCFWVTLGSTFYYNEHATGAANVYAQPLCAGAANPRATFVHGCALLRAGVPSGICVGKTLCTLASECARESYACSCHAFLRACGRSGVRPPRLFG
jgi:hypothetical protein